MKSEDIFYALWVGESLPPLAAGCLRSFVRHGHRVQLYVYDEMQGLPEGVEIKDASLILGRDRIFRHYRTKTLSVFSDHFAYSLLNRLGGTWIDCDMYCVRPIPSDEEYLFCRESEDRIAKGVFRLPKGSPITTDLLGVFEHRQSYLPWLLPGTRRRAWFRHHLLRRPYYEVIPVATTGPAAVTYFLERYGLTHLAKTVDSFLPLKFEDAARIAEAGFHESQFLTANSLTIHLWNDARKVGNAPPEPGSLMARIEEEGRGGAAAITLD